MNAYCNMGVPPRTAVKQIVRPIGRYVEFNIYDADFSPPFKSPKDFCVPQDWLDDFLSHHGDALDAIQRPSGLCSVYVFSTVVHSANAGNLAARNFISTGGTDINCVVRHVLSLPKRKRPQSVVVVTDGYVGRPNAALAAKFRAAGMRFYVGLVKSDSSLVPELDLSSLAHQFVKLFNRH